MESYIEDDCKDNIVKNMENYLILPLYGQPTPTDGGFPPFPD